MPPENVTVIFLVMTPLVTAAVSWGAQRAGQRAMKEQLDELKASIQRFGERLGMLEAEVKVLKALDERDSQPISFPPRGGE